MSEIPALNVLRGAGWCLVLLLLASLGGIGSSTAETEPVASSIYARPVAVLHEIRLPDTVPVPTSTPAPTPKATSTPAPTPVPSPAAQSAPQAASELAPPPAPQPASAPTPAPTPPPPAPQRYLDTDAAAAIISLTNDLRAQYGLPPLATNGALTAAAQAYAETMATNDWFSHEGSDGTTVSSRAQAAGYTGWSYLAENLYRGPSGEAAANVVQVWAASPAHHDAMMSTTATEIGAGCYVSGDQRWCALELGAR